MSVEQPEIHSGGGGDQTRSYNRVNVPKKINEVAELNLKAIKINTSLLLSDLQRTCTEKKINKTKTVRGACGLYPPAVYDRFIFPVTQTWPRGRRL